MIFPTDHSYIADLPGSKAEPDAHDDKIQWLGHCTKGDFFFQAVDGEKDLETPRNSGIGKGCSMI
jgi:hypothetical protein